MAYFTYRVIQTLLTLVTSTVIVISIHSILAKAKNYRKSISQTAEDKSKSKVSEFNNKIHNQDIAHVSLAIFLTLFGMTCSGLTLINVEDWRLGIKPIKALIYILQDMGVYFPSVLSCFSLFLTNFKLRAYSIDLLKTRKL